MSVLRAFLNLFVQRALEVLNSIITLDSPRDWIFYQVVQTCDDLFARICQLERCFLLLIIFVTSLSLDPFNISIYVSAEINLLDCFKDRHSLRVNI